MRRFITGNGDHLQNDKLMFFQLGCATCEDRAVRQCEHCKDVYCSFHMFGTTCWKCEEKIRKTIEKLSDTCTECGVEGGLHKAGCIEINPQ